MPKDEGLEGKLDEPTNKESNQSTLENIVKQEKKGSLFPKLLKTSGKIALSAGMYYSSFYLFGTNNLFIASIAAGFLFYLGAKLGGLIRSTGKKPHNMSEFVRGTLFGALGYLAYALLVAPLPNITFGDKILKTLIMNPGYLFVENSLYLGSEYLFSKRNFGQIVKGLFNGQTYKDIKEAYTNAVKPAIKKLTLIGLTGLYFQYGVSNGLTGHPYIDGIAEKINFTGIPQLFNNIASSPLNQEIATAVSKMTHRIILQMFTPKAKAYAADNYKNPTDKSSDKLPTTGKADNYNKQYNKTG